jgi:hypothetical protein
MVLDEIELVDNKKADCLRMILYALSYLAGFKLVISDEPNAAFRTLLAGLSDRNRAFFAGLDEIFITFAQPISLVREIAITSRFTIVGTAN